MTPLLGQVTRHPEVLVSTEWLAQHLDDPAIRILEVDWDPKLTYELGHIPGAALVDWKRDINDTVRRDILTRDQFVNLMERLRVTPHTTLVLYGDLRNWFAAFAFWTFKIYGHRDIRLLNGGRLKWFEEERLVTETVPSFSGTTYPTPVPTVGLRQFLPGVRDILGRLDHELVNVRSPAEFGGGVFPPLPITRTRARSAVVTFPVLSTSHWAEAVFRVTIRSSLWNSSASCTRVEG